MRSVVLWIVLLFAGVEGRATRMVPLSVEELAAGSDIVAHGIVQAITTSRDADGRIFTTVEVRGVTTWKGTLPGPTCLIVFGGGVLGDRIVAVEGQGHYTIGEEIVAFLVRNDAGEWVTVGMAQGKFHVRVGADSRRYVSNVFLGGMNAGGGDRIGSGGVAGGAKEVLTLESLRRRTQEASR